MKSTVAQLVPRFYDPTAGAVRLHGHDLRDITLDSLRAAVGIVPEESFLFSESVRTNIAYGHPEAPEVHEKEIVKQDVVPKLSSGDYRAVFENEGTWGLVAKKAPQFGDDAAVVVVSTIY